MRIEDLKRVLKLQEQAYNLLLWIGRRAESQPGLLGDESVTELRTGAGAQAWVRRMQGSLPVEWRPEQGDIPAFARLLSAFFTTSFRLETVNQRGRRVSKLTLGLKSNNKRNKRRAAGTARALERIWLIELAGEAGIPIGAARADELMRQPAVQDDLVVWSYACELLRRSQYASQGVAVHAMWRSMDQQQRGRPDANEIWAARERLLTAL